MERADAVFSANMVQISPWESAIGLAEGASQLLAPGAPLILYGPWLTDSIQTAPSNLAFDTDLKRRNPAWGLRRVEDFQREAGRFGLSLAEIRAMPANNLILLFRKGTQVRLL